MKTLTTMMMAMVVVGASAVASAKPTITPQRARAEAIKALKAKGLSTNVRVHTRGLGYGRGGKEKLVLIENVNSGKVMEAAVSNKRTRILNTKLFDQKQASVVARGAMRRERAPKAGTFSGDNKSGFSGSGKTYRFGSATDRSEKTYVSVKTGRVMTKSK